MSKLRDNKWSYPAAAVFAACLSMLLFSGSLAADELARPVSAKKALRKAEKQFKPEKPDKARKAELKALKRETKLFTAKPKRKAVPVTRDNVANRAPYSPAQSFRAQSGERMTVDLPAKYGELDTDFDGQVGMYEWIVARRESLELFDEIDSDFDGLLTPRELKEFDEVASGASGAESLAKRYERPRLLIVGGPTATARGGRKPFMSKEDRQKQEQMAEKIFPHVDKDKDGRISANELRESKKLNYMFDKAGIKIEDMSQQQFTQRYADSIDFFAEQKANEREKGQGGK